MKDLDRIEKAKLREKIESLKAELKRIEEVITAYQSYRDNALIEIFKCEIMLNL